MMQLLPTGKMRSYLLVLAVATFAGNAVYGDSKITKLQIGVKKRIPAEECTVKSRKGDKLKMHYTVSAQHSVILMMLSNCAKCR